MSHYNRLLLFILMVFFSNVCMPSFAATQQMKSTSIPQKLEELEAASGGKIGIAAINTAFPTVLQYHAEERFPLCSTAKVMVVAAILKQSMTNKNLLQQKITYSKKDLIEHSPVTEKHLADGMTIAQLCAAAMTQTDNTAMNLLMKKLGGPKAVNAFARSIGNTTFQLDRWEPELNSAIPGDVRDTSTPIAMAASLQHLALGNVLALPQRELLQNWLKNSLTGNTRIRAGVPKNWIVGDKTGTGDYGTTNDIGIIWPPHNTPPIVIAVYFTQNKKDATSRDDVIASATRLVVNSFTNIEKQQTHVLEKIIVPKTDYELGMGIGEMAPNTIKSLRKQAGPEVVYVLKGELLLMIKGQLTRTIKTGESFQIQAGVIHETRAGPKGAKFLASWVEEQGKENQFVVPFTDAMK